MSSPPERPDRGGPLSGGDVARLTDEIAGLTRVGLPLPSGVLALAEELPRGRLRDALRRLAATLEEGTSLEEALNAQGPRLPSHLRGLVVAAARTGKLGEVLGRFSGYANVGIDLRRALWIRLINPIFLLVCSVAVLIFVSAVLMTGFSEIFSDFGVRTPAITRVALAVAAAVGRLWWPFVEGLIGIAGLLALGLLFLPTDVRRGGAWAIPLFGPVWHLSDLAEFSHLLALLLESDVPLPEALTMAGDGVRNTEVAAAARSAAREITGGSTLAATTSLRRLFPPGFARILAWSEGHRGLPEALHMAGEMFEARARSQAEFVNSVCSVLALLSLLGGVLTLIVAVFVPMFTLIRNLSG